MQVDLTQYNMTILTEISELAKATNQSVSQVIINSDVAFLIEG